jgi:acetyl esterase/lipase
MNTTTANANTNTKGAQFEVSDHLYREVEGVKLLGTLYRPKSKAVCPLVMEVHGGAWTANDRHTNALIHRYLAARGIAVFSIDFRMPPNHPYPAALLDINYATRWVKQNAARFGSRRELVGGVATSSGGHLLMLGLMRSISGRYQPEADDLAEQDASLPYAVACWPVLDPLARYRWANQHNNERLISAHHAFWRDEAQMSDANPLRMLQRGEESFLPNVLLLQGTADANFDYRNTVDFAQAYRKAGGQAQLELYDGEPHAFIKEDLPSTARTAALECMHQFIQRESARAGQGDAAEQSSAA